VLIKTASDKPVQKSNKSEKPELELQSLSMKVLCEEPRTYIYLHHVMHALQMHSCIHACKCVVEKCACAAVSSFALTHPFIWFVGIYWNNLIVCLDLMFVLATGHALWFYLCMKYYVYWFHCHYLSLVTMLPFLSVSSVVLVNAF